MRELKYKIFYSILTIILTSLSCYIYINQLMYVLTYYLLYNMNSQRFIFTKLTELFFTYIKFSLISGLFFSLPCILFSFWLFFIPGLYKYERQYLNWYTSIVIIIFILSCILNYYLILPNVLNFFLFFENNNNFFPVHFEARLKDYLFPILLLLFNITLCFQIPSIIILLLFFNFIDYNYLVKNRKYFYLTFIFISALIAPPDIYNQVVLTLLIIMLYELLLFCLFFVNRFFSIS